MNEKIIKILKQHVEVFGSVSIENYIEKLEDEFGIKPDLTFFDGYQTIITLGIGYPSKPTKFSGKGFGILSRYSYGTDYHIVFDKIISNIIKELKILGIKAKGNVDISPLHERFAAKCSSLGFIGKNDFLIHKEYGSYLYLGTILVNNDVQIEQSIVDDCGDCTICIDACPSDALTNGFEESKCISGISQEKIPFSIDEIKYFKTMIYGCDICQRVCPKNKGVNFTKHQEFEPSGIENINLLELLEMSNKEYMAIYKNNASSWRGPLVLKRNALCLLANQKQYGAIDKIKESKMKYKSVLWYNKTADLVIKMLERE
jgi:epoxyqueuosine reductase